ncbi:MAG: lipopolysaccharide heptosyltransferase I [Burkholderiaceae bacterium]
MRLLIVKLSSLGDVVHALPVVHDIQAAFPRAVIDWVVEPAFASLLRRVEGVDAVIECALRRWSRAWWTGAVRAEWRAFKTRLRRERYDAVLDLQGLTKSVLIARLAQLSTEGARHGLANRTEGSSYEAPARWGVDHAIRIEPHIHAIDRSRELAARALGYTLQGPPCFGLQAARAPRVAGAAPMLVFVHGSSRDTKLWPEDAWVELGRRAAGEGWRVALPHAGATELERAQRIARTLVVLNAAVEVWPAMGLDALVDRLGAAQGVIGVDSGLSHIAVALDLPHVQIYNFPTSWRTGPQATHDHRHQVAIEAQPAPSVDAVWSAWARVREAAGA